MRLRVAEGARMDGVYVFTEAELRRVIRRHQGELFEEVRRLRDALRHQQERIEFDNKTWHAVERRRETYRQSTGKRYDRYKALLAQTGEKHAGSTWARHLAELDKRLA